MNKRSTVYVGLDVHKSKASRFTARQRVQSTRRTSNSRKTRYGPHGRSRTRRVRRSYHPDCAWPQAPQRVFLSAGPA